MSNWLNNVTNALESLDQAAENALTTEEQRNNAEIQRDEQRTMALEEAIEKEREIEESNGMLDAGKPSLRRPASGSAGRRTDGHAGGAAVDGGSTSNRRAASSSLSLANEGGGEYQDAEPAQAFEHRRSVADDLTDDLYAVEQALARERELRQRDKEEAAVREETLQKANGDLTKALTSAERTIESLRDAADMATMESFQRDAARHGDDAQVGRLSGEVERLKREIVKRDIEIDSLAVKCKEFDARTRRFREDAEETTKRYERVQRTHREESAVQKADYERLKRHTDRLQQELETYMGKSAMLQERVNQIKESQAVGTGAAGNGGRRRRRYNNKSDDDDDGGGGEDDRDSDDLESGGYRGRGVVRRRTKGIASALAPLTPMMAKNRSVRRAIDKVDRWSLETGAVLRQFPLARLVFVVYLVTLHLWVLFLLGRNSHNMNHNEHASNGALNGAMPMDPGPPVPI
jgi:hypothetical protein